MLEEKRHNIEVQNRNNSTAASIRRGGLMQRAGRIPARAIKQRKPTKKGFLKYAI